MYTFSVPANMGARSGEKLALSMIMSLLNDSGANRTYTFKAKFGGTTFINDALIAVPTSVFPRALMVEVFIANEGTVSTQVVGATVSISDVSANGAVYGDLSAAPLLPAATRHVAGTITQTSAQTLEVTLQSDAATATQTIVMRSALLTLT